MIQEIGKECGIYFDKIKGKMVDHLNTCQHFLETDPTDLAVLYDMMIGTATEYNMYLIALFQQLVEIRATLKEAKAIEILD